MIHRSTYKFLFILFELGAFPTLHDQAVYLLLHSYVELITHLLLGKTITKWRHTGHLGCLGLVWCFQDPIVAEIHYFLSLLNNNENKRFYLRQRVVNLSDAQ